MKRPQDSVTFDTDIRERLFKEMAETRDSLSKTVNTLVTEAFRERDRRKGWKKKNNPAGAQ